MDELDIADSKAAFTLIHSLSGSLPQTDEVHNALRILQGTVLELEAWKKLKDPGVLHANLLAGKPSKLSPASLLHLVGAGECSNAGGCLKKLNQDDLRKLQPDHLGGESDCSEIPAITPLTPSGDDRAPVSSLSDEEHKEIELWLRSVEGREAMRNAMLEARDTIAQIGERNQIDPEVWQRAIGPLKR